MEVIKDIFTGEMETTFLLEIALRTIVMFLLILVVLRLSGRRGVRQLTLFEMAIIISLGSAAGDPMFQGDLPVLYAVVVFICVIGFYKVVTWLISRSPKAEKLLEGEALYIVKDGIFDLKNEKDNTFSRMEFFAELRNLNIEHLGQVRQGLLEVDGTLSVLFYSDEEVKYGLPLFPSSFVEVNVESEDGPFACMYCGYVEQRVNMDNLLCKRCNRRQWTRAINSKRIT